MFIFTAKLLSRIYPPQSCEENSTLMAALSARAKTDLQESRAPAGTVSDYFCPPPPQLLEACLQMPAEAALNSKAQSSRRHGRAEDGGGEAPMHLQPNIQTSGRFQQQKGWKHFPGALQMPPAALIRPHYPAACSQSDRMLSDLPINSASNPTPPHPPSPSFCQDGVLVVVLPPHVIRSHVTSGCFSSIK